MTSSYYYLIASLPHLSFHRPQPISIAAFSAQCSNYLKPHDFEVIQSVLSGKPGKTALSLAVYKAWREQDMTLRVELASLRGAKIGRSEGPEVLKKAVHGPSPGGALQSAREAAGRAFTAGSPLEADELIENDRWKKLEALEYGLYFNLEWLVIYALKLQIMERRENFDMESGMDRVDAILAAARDASVEGQVEEVSHAA